VFEPIQWSYPDYAGDKQVHLFHFTSLHILFLTIAEPVAHTRHLQFVSVGRQFFALISVLSFRNYFNDITSQVTRARTPRRRVCTSSKVEFTFKKARKERVKQQCFKVLSVLNSFSFIVAINSAKLPIFCLFALGSV
jgi:hypothetical protein